jgi:hypothetical protein
MNLGRCARKNSKEREGAKSAMEDAKKTNEFRF